MYRRYYKATYISSGEIMYIDFFNSLGVLEKYYNFNSNLWKLFEVSNTLPTLEWVKNINKGFKYTYISKREAQRLIDCNIMLQELAK
jgi:hypothetical protein